MSKPFKNTQQKKDTLAINKKAKEVTRCHGEENEARKYLRSLIKINLDKFQTMR